MIKHTEELDAVTLSLTDSDGHPVIQGVYVRLQKGNDCIYTNLNGGGVLINVENGMTNDEFDTFNGFDRIQTNRTRVRLTIEEIPGTGCYPPVDGWDGASTEEISE